MTPVEPRGGIPSLERALGDPEIAGARGWLTGYVVPVTSGRLGGELRVVEPAGRAERVSRVSHDGDGLSRSQLGLLAGRVAAVGQVQHGGAAAAPSPDSRASRRSYKKRQ